MELKSVDLHKMVFGMESSCHNLEQIKDAVSTPLPVRNVQSERKAYNPITMLKINSTKVGFIDISLHDRPSDLSWSQKRHKFA